MNYEIGQALVYVRNDKRIRSEPEPVVVTKVGRKWVSFEGGERNFANRFDQATGWVDGGSYSSPGRIYPSMQAYQEELDKEQALEELRRRLDWRSGKLPDGLTAQRVRLAMGMLLAGGDTDPLQALCASQHAMKRVLAQSPDWCREDLERAIRLCEQLSIGGPQQ